MFLCCKILKLISLAYAAVSYITAPPLSPLPPALPLATIYGHMSTTREQLIVLPVLGLQRPRGDLARLLDNCGATKGRANV